MAFRATFIGINKHLDTQIPELASAVRDAKAMWALFSDSIPDIDSQILLDDKATIGAIRKSLDSCIKNVNADDTALFYFAGHGTEDHRLVPYDMDQANLSSTLLLMDELAQYLSTSPAKVIIVILDCCFSGGSTARVLKGLPISRSSGITISSLQGKGRVIIAAANENQPAYEVGDHGLLTGVLLQVLTEKSGTMNIGDLSDQVTSLVRTEAQRFGFDQTPVIFNLIEGGLTLPPLQRGTLYHKEFPNTSAIQISSDISELASFGIPSSLITAWQQAFTRGLNDLQLAAINRYRVLDGKSLLVVAPTSSGKTFIGEMAAAKAIADGRKAVFLLPYRALTNEKFEDLERLYGQSLGLRIIRCTGDHSDSVQEYLKGTYDIALFTYEMFLGLISSIPTSLNKIGLIVLDEAQFITDSSRGINVELLLTSLLMARQRGVSPQLIALSAVIGEINCFHEWLDCEAHVTYERPISLIEGVIDRTGAYQHLDENGKECVMQLLPSHSVVQRRDKPSSQDIIVLLVQQLIANGENVIVFRNQRGSTVGAANYLADALGLPPASNVLQSISNSDPSRATLSLRSALQGGVAFHNSDLVREERTAIEREFRKQDGSIRVIAATTTVAAGVNTPATTVIIAETFFYGEEQRDFTVAEYKNMAGRAGRLGYSDYGRSVILADSAWQRDHLFQKYVKGNPEPITSSFIESDIDTWILRLLTQAEKVEKGRVADILVNTYGGYLASRKNPDWRQHIYPQINELIKQMSSLRLLEEEDSFIRLSLLGQACARTNLSFRSAMHLVSTLSRQSSSINADSLLALLQTIPEVAGYLSVHKKAAKESSWQRDVTSYYGTWVTQALQYGANSHYEYYGRCKRSAILWEWTHGVPLEEIEQKYSVTPFAGNVGAGDIRGCADRSRMYLHSAYVIADLLLLGNGPGEDEVDALLKQLEFGIPREALCLLELPVRLSRGEYLALHSRGYQKPQEVIGAGYEELMKYLSVENTRIIVESTPDT